MKRKILSIVFALLLIPAIASAVYLRDIIIPGPDGLWIDSRAYATLNLAVAAAAGNTRTVVIVEPEVVTTLTVPGNVTLMFLRNGTIANTGQLNIDTFNVIAEDRQIFTGNGDIDFIAGSVVRSSWFDDLHVALDVTHDDDLTMVMTGSLALDASAAVGNAVTLRWESRFIINTGAFTMSNVKNIEAGSFQLFGGGEFDFLAGSVLRSSWFTSLVTAQDFTADGVNLTILIDRPEITDNVTFDEYQRVEVTNGSVISVNPGQTLTFGEGSKLRLSWFDSLGDFIDHNGTTNVTLIIDVDDAMGGDETVPDTVDLRCRKGYEIDGAHTLTINGPFEAGLPQCFGDSVTVVFGPESVAETRVEWLDVDGTNDYVEMQKMIDWSSTRDRVSPVEGEGKIVRLLAKQYSLGSTGIELWENSKLRGSGAAHVITDPYGGTWLLYAGSNEAIKVDGTVSGFDARRSIDIREMSIRCTNVTNSTGIHFDFATRFSIEDMLIHNALDYGLKFTSSHHGKVSRVKVLMDADASSNSGSALYFNVDPGEDVFSGQTLIESCELHDGNIGAEIVNTTNVLANLVFIQTHFKTNNYNVHLSGGGTHRVFLDGCHLEGGKINDIYVASSITRGPVVVGSYFNNGQAVFKIDLQGNGASIRDSEFVGSNTGYGIKVAGEDNVIRDNLFYHNNNSIVVMPGHDNTVIGHNWFDATDARNIYDPYLMEIGEAAVYPAIGTFEWHASGGGVSEYYVTIAGAADPGWTTAPDFVTEDGDRMPEDTIGALDAGDWGYGNGDALGFDTIYVRLTDGTDPDLQAASFSRAGYRAPLYEGEVWLYSKQFDLSGAADSHVVFLPDRRYWVRDIQIAYVENTSADAGVSLKFGYTSDTDRYMDRTSGVSRTANAQDFEVPSTTLVAPGNPLIFSSAGGKVGTGETRMFVRLVPFKWD